MPEIEESIAATPVRSKQPAWLRALAMLVSVLCHPVFFLPVMGSVLYLLAPDQFAGITLQQAKRWLLIISLLTVFFPLFSVLLMKGLGFVSSLHLRNPKDRIIPLIASMTFYFWASHVFNHFPQAPLCLRALLLGAFWGIIGLFLINIFFKISMHTTAAGGMLGVLTLLMLQSQINLITSLFAGIMLAGLIGTSRLILGEHRPSELWLGYALGFAVQIGAWYFLK